jgi:hypothetical protein
VKPYAKRHVKVYADSDDQVVTRDGISAAPRLVWTDEFPDLLPDELMPRKRKRPHGRPPEQLTKAGVFLIDMLEDGPMPADELLTKATKEGITERTLRQAKRGLKIASKKRGDTWEWKFSQETDEIIRQAEEG